MMNGIGKAGSARPEAVRTQATTASQRPQQSAVSTEKVAAWQPSSALGAAEGPPVDAAKVARIKAAIAEGRYPVDPDAIAQRMIELDLPGLK